MKLLHYCIVFCKPHLAAGKTPLFPVVETQPNTHLHLQYLTSSLHTCLVGAEFFICAQKPNSVYKYNYSRNLRRNKLFNILSIRKL